jgi:hypothetical protein
LSFYDLHYNKDDVYLRNVIIGLLATLHDNIIWYNQIGRNVDEVKEIRIPFYFSTTGSERYLQDNFLNNIDFDPGLLEAETFYNKIPRAIVDLSGVSIETQAIVNKYIRMNKMKQEPDGTLNTYSYETYMVPVLLNFDCTIYTDSILDQLKCTESVIKTFYKNKAYQIDIAYTRIPCLIMLPDEAQNERTVEYSFTDRKEFKTSFALQVKSHLPIFRPETEIFAGKTMQNMGWNVYVPPFTVQPDTLNSQTGVTSVAGSTAYQGSSLEINASVIPQSDQTSWPSPDSPQGEIPA